VPKISLGRRRSIFSIPIIRSRRYRATASSTWNCWFKAWPRPMSRRSATKKKTRGGHDFIDAIFSPVLKVNFTVSQRPGRPAHGTTTVWCSMSIPTAASSPTMHGLRGRRFCRIKLSIFVNFQDEPRPEKRDDGPVDPAQRKFVPQDVDEWSFPCARKTVCRTPDIKYIWRAGAEERTEMLRTKNFGHKSLNEIKKFCARWLGAGMKVDHFPARSEIEARKREITKELARKPWRTSQMPAGN